MSEFQFNCMTHTNRLMRIGSQRHHQSVQEAQNRQPIRAADSEHRRLHRQKLARITLDISLGAAIAISILATIGFLTTVAS